MRKLLAWLVHLYTAMGLVCAAGMAVLAGFGVVRFLKSSVNDADSANPPPASSNNSASKPVRWHDDSKGYRDEFTK